MHETARVNFEELRQNPYPGRGIVVGMDESGNHLVQVYWIMGRSKNSRNRLFKSKDKWLIAAPADPSQVENPSLILYTAMDELGQFSVVSNGNQTSAFIEAARMNRIFMETMWQYQYEPDVPNFTPRITALCSVNGGFPTMEMLVFRKSPWDTSCDRNWYHFGNLGKGFGYCITTYSGPGDPLPSFHGEPYLLPLVGCQKAIAETYWEALNGENRISLAVKFIDVTTTESVIHIINKYTRVEATTPKTG